MSNEHHFTPSENNEPEQDPFARLDLFEHDPRFAQVLFEIETLQANYTHTAATDLATVLLELNEKLENIQWIGDTVAMTGKLRVAPWSQNNTFENNYFKQSQLVFGDDERGAYCYINDFSLIMALVDVDEDEHFKSENGRYVLTFHTPDTLVDAQDDHDEFEVLRSSAGDFIVYPDELEVMKFNTPSLEQIERTLSLYYPAVYKEVFRTIGTDTGRHASRLLSDLKQFTLPLQRGGFDLDTLGQIGRYIYDRADIDQESDYRFVVNGPIEGMSIESGLVSNRSNGEQRISGSIVALDFDLETMQLVFVVSELSSIGEGFELRVIPVKHVEKLHCIRPLQSRFGSVAMKNFDSVFDVQEFWSSQRAAKSQNNQSEVEVLFSNVNSIFKETEVEYVYNEQGKFYELSIEEDIAQLIEQYVHHLHAAVNQQSEATDSTHIDALLMRDIEALTDVALGDVIATKQQAITMEPLKPHDDGTVDFLISVLEGAQRLKGTFTALQLAQFPSEAAIHSGGEVHELKPSLGMVLKDAVIFEDGTPESEHDICDGEVIVLIAPSVGTHFVKVVKGAKV